MTDFFGIPIEWILGPFGAIIVLLGLSYLGIKGIIMPKSVVNKMMDEQRKASEITAKAIGSEITKGMQEAVHKGIKTGLSSGYLRMAKINGERSAGKRRRR
jgi:hypothetical protein